MLGDTARGNYCPAGQAHRLPAAEGGGGRGAQGQKPGRQAFRQPSPSGRLGKNPGLKKNPAQWVFWGFLGFLGFFEFFQFQEYF
jgi:hypothetical protein